MKSSVKKLMGGLMMSNEMLKQFYWGKLVSWEIRQSTSELVELNGEIDADITYLKEKLSAADREVLERLVSNFFTLESEQICQGYIDGFKHGSLMILEILSPDKSL